MHNKARVTGIFVLVFGAIVTTLVFPSRPSYVDVVGHVYESYSAERPVAGAVVSNDWDSTTAKTNDQGEFRLRVRQVAVDEHIKFTARSGERTAYQRLTGSLRLTPVVIFMNDPNGLEP